MERQRRERKSAAPQRGAGMLRVLIVICGWALGLSGTPGARAQGFAHRPAAIDDAGWQSLQQAVTKAIGQQARLTTGDGAAADIFGAAVALDGDTALIGAWGNDLGGNIDQGSAYVFVRSGAVWVQQARMTASDGAAGDQFGFSVALQGNTALVGAPGDDSNRGSAYVFTRSGASWSQRSKLTAADGAAGDTFGNSVVLDGDTALIGALFDDIGANLSQGSAYVFTGGGSTWSEQDKLTAADGAEQDTFGASVALDGDTALVGAANKDIGANSTQGAAYVFIRTGTVWVQQDRLIASEGAASDGFGGSVALDGDTALIGAAGNDIGANIDQGSAYVFTRIGQSWSEQVRLTAGDGDAGDRFGNSVALRGDTALIGALFDDIGANLSQGSAYVFTGGGSSWSEQAKLTHGDGEGGDEFGVRVALDGDTALIGAYLDDVGTAMDQGSAYVFTGGGASWSEQARLTSGDGEGGDQFGLSLALDGDTALVGAYLDDIGASDDQGSAYVFTRSGTLWTHQAKLTAIDGAPDDQFGISVALDGDTALIGAHLDDIGTKNNQGSAYVFTRSGSAWGLQAKLGASDGAADDGFGRSVALAGDSALIGAWLDDVGANVDRGSAYVFTRTGTNWSEQDQLIAADGAGLDRFGVSVALDGDSALIGAYRDSVGANVNQGSAYVFTRSGMVWSEQTRLTAGDGGPGDQFGISVALDGDSALIGAFTDNIGPNSDQGSAYVFTRGGTAWSEQDQLTASDGADSDLFGWSVALNGDVALVGAYLDDVNGTVDQGSVYGFVRTGTSWSEEGRLTASDGEADDEFGISIALDGDLALIGSFLDDVDEQLDQGSAYAFTGIFSLSEIFADSFEDAAVVMAAAAVMASDQR